MIIFCTTISGTYFNSQPHKEADDLSKLQLRINYHFNSQPHKEADNSLCNVYFVIEISTHSLTRRLTATRLSYKPNFMHFNSQPHKEADLVAVAKSKVTKDISTHSLTRRLTI